MPIEASSEQDRHERLQASLEALNARIARLAIGLGVSLDTDAEIAHLMRQKHPASPLAHERRSGTGPVDTSHMEANSDRRVAQKIEELRGLLVLRYGVEKRFVEDVGVEATRQILADAEAHLSREGFKPGADGLGLDRLFK